MKKKKPNLMVGYKIKLDKAAKQAAAKMKALALERKRALEKEQADCPHTMGCNPLSDCPDLFGRASIAWHRFNDGVIRGVCTTCQRVFTPEDKDYEEQRRRHTTNKLSEAVSTQADKDHDLTLEDLEALADEEVYKLFHSLKRLKG